jgi:hypothetical protein
MELSYVHNFIMPLSTNKVNSNAVSKLGISRALLLYLESLDRITVPNLLTKRYRDFT